jgi:FKBP-type peptidyl-prolyl cis-trans isomerase FklB
MKVQLIVLTILAFATIGFAEEQVLLQTEKDKISYSIGVSIAKGLVAQGIECNPEFVARGIQDTLSGGQALMTEAEVQQLLLGLQQKVRDNASENLKKEGEAFLAENAKKPGVVTLPSGLQYKVIQAGTGPKPKAEDTVVTNYRGTFIDGTEFDSSEKNGGPATFAVNGVIQGWTEALQLMEVGAKWQLFVPSSLAYGEKGAGEVIGPNTTLIFDLELLEIKAPAATK